MKVLIIDDESKARNVLRVLLKEHCPKITNILEANLLIDGVELIKEHNPDIVFLDIEMPEHSGLEIVNYLDTNDFDFEIIFTTAYSEYAIQAFKLAALDYLLKPLRAQQIIEVVEKVDKKQTKSQLNQQLLELKNSLSQLQFNKIALPYSKGIKFLSFKDIILFEADGMYTKVYTTQDTILVCKPLKFFVNALANISLFYRPHRSFLVNLSFLKEYIKNDGGYIVMENNKTVSIARDKKNEFLTIVQSI